MSRFENSNRKRTFGVPSELEDGVRHEPSSQSDADCARWKSGRAEPIQMPGGRDRDGIRNNPTPALQSARDDGPERFVEAEEAALFLHYSPRSVKQMARDGKIPAHPFGDGARKHWFFLISELAEFLRRRVNSLHGEADRDKTTRRVN
jgi:hypothetical protein